MVVILFVLGLVFGSFISALTWRYPRGISVKKGRSVCPKCRKQIAWYDNIPLLSYILLGGKCRNCRKPISWRYPVIELATGIGFLLIGPQILWLIIFCILEIIFIIDFEHQIIPDSFVFAGLFLSLFLIPDSLFGSLFAGFLASTLLVLIHLLTKGRGMGLGDVKFAVLGGMLVGLKLLPVWFFLAFLTGAFIGIILILGRKARLKSQIAFGPFLVAAIPLSLLYGEKILAWLHLN
ncbi:MAG: Type 4 prepilin-like protein leader peptide-processing enzyme [Candidatus Woesebacteria bacterium GW2011_GWB1_44_11]|uniref:Type 4 prepilin-like protein leader peptide-processing enzyme n=1 Tax=Candidatus Woesebacteria bacterium GW2011_GWB1_44_11 TaxID=1618579 RepID=A0A837I6W4_9BACT|nr:MAG: Type 4 prepilin-like protein leader peptide-processing enzyme [Candidatus Woesebacteria bacterium GW2011_GWB1_44_11]